MSTLDALKLGYFRNYCLGQAVSIIGRGMQAVAIPWLVWRQTGSPWALGLVASTTALALCFCPVGGILADRFNRKILLLFSTLTPLLLSSILGIAILTNHFNLWFLLSINFAMGLVTAIDYPARQTFNRDMVDTKHIASVIGIYSAVDNVSYLSGQALGGLVIAQHIGNGEAFCILANAIGCLAALWALSMVPSSIVSIYSLPSSNIETKSPSMRDCIKFAWSDKTTSIFMLQTIFLFAFGMRYNALIPAFASKVLHKGAEINGLLYAAISLGSIIGVLFTSSLPTLKLHLRWSKQLILVLPLVLLLFATSSTVPFAFILLLLLMFVVAAANNSNQIGIQIHAPQQMQGRILSWRTTLIWAVDFILTPFVGYIGSTFGVHFAFIAVAIACAIFTLPMLLIRSPEQIVA